jgi:hypothetical protein
MGTRRLVATTIALACLALGACGSDGEGPDVSLPTSVSLPDRSTTVPPDSGVTQPPSTETPTTETPTTETRSTEVPPSEPPTTEGVAAGPPEAAEDDPTVWWPWLLAAVLVGGLIAFLVTRKSRRATAWRQQTATAFDEATHLATHLAAVAPEGAAMVAAQDAGQLADLAARLSALRAEASDEAQRRAIGSVHDQVQSLHGVVDGIAMGSGPATPAALAYLREQATALHGATARARAEVLPGTPGPGTHSA